MKRLVICCDGTWNSADDPTQATNVVKMSRAIPAVSEEGIQQTIYYDEGVGTGNAVDRFLGGVVGLGLNKNVLQAYQFLAQNYQDGDDLIFFGFSRGAYTVRALAGLVAKVGLLQKLFLHELPDIYEQYRSSAKLSDEYLKSLKPKVAAYPAIQFLGVWDTVGSLGIPSGPFRWIGRAWYDFHDVELNPRILNARQALAIDETRKHFKPAVWDTTAQAGTTAGAAPQTVKQLWFAGAHSNVGGGYEESTLADIAFQWMAEEAQPFLALDKCYLERHIPPLSEDFWGDLPPSRTGVYKLFRPHLREIGPEPTEEIHVSALQRMEWGDPGRFTPYPYRPANVLRFLRTYTASNTRAGD